MLVSGSMKGHLTRWPLTDTRVSPYLSWFSRQTIRKDREWRKGLDHLQKGFSNICLWHDNNRTSVYTYRIEWPSISRILELAWFWAYSKIFLFRKKSCNIFLVQNSGNFRCRIFLKPILLSISCEKSFFKILLFLWADFMTFTLVFLER